MPQLLWSFDSDRLIQAALSRLLTTVGPSREGHLREQRLIALKEEGGLSLVLSVSLCFGIKDWVRMIAAPLIFQEGVVNGCGLASFWKNPPLPGGCGWGTARGQR